MRNRRNAAMILSSLVLCGMFVLGFSSLAQADSIGGTGSSCATCQGATYTLSYSGTPFASGGGVDIFHITLEIDTSTYTGGGGFIDAAAIKVSNSVFAVSLFAAPGGVGNWSALFGDISSDACMATSGSGGFSCAAYAPMGPGVAVGGTLSWTFAPQILMTETLFTGLNQASIQARYVDNNGNKVGALVSENITLMNTTANPVPEPSTMLLLGSGLVGLIGYRMNKA